MRYVTAGDSKTPRREAHGAATPALFGPSGTAQYHLRGMSDRDLTTPPEPSAVTGDGIQRSSAVPSLRSAPGLAKSRAVAPPGRGADATEPHVPGSQRSRAVCSADVAYGNGLLSHQHRSIWHRNHDDVTSPWSGPLQSHIVVVTRTTPSRVHALRRGYRAVQVTPRQPRDARDGWCCVGSGEEVASGGAGTKTSGGPGTMAKRPVPSGNRPRCARARAGRLARAGGSRRAGARVRRWLRLGRRSGCGSCWGRPGCRGPSWW